MTCTYVIYYIKACINLLITYQDQLYVLFSYLFMYRVGKKYVYSYEHAKYGVYACIIIY